MKIRLFSFTFLFIASLFVGFRSGDRFAGGEPPRPAMAASSNVGNSTFPVSIRSLGNGQRSILVVVANSLQTRRPRLESAWLVIYVPTEPHLTFLPIYPSIQADSASDRILETSFRPVFGSRKSRGLALNQAFFAALQDQNLWWSGYLLLDEKSFGEAYAHFIEAAQPDKQKSPAGLPLLNLLTMKQDPSRKAFALSAKDPEAALFAQAKLFEEMCWSASQSGSKPVFTSLQPVIQELPQNSVTDMNLKKVLAELEAMRKRNQGVLCEFPTVSMHILTSR